MNCLPQHFPFAFVFRYILNSCLLLPLLAQKIITRKTLNSEKVFLPFPVLVRLRQAVLADRVATSINTKQHRVIFPFRFTDYSLPTPQSYVTDSLE